MAISDVAIASLEEAVNHLRNRHAHAGFHTGEPRACRLHEATNEDGTAYKSRAFNDCPDFFKKMETWLTESIIARIGDIIHPTLGAISQNASERVGDVALGFREKSTDLRATHYVAATSLAIAHVNSVVICAFLRKDEIRDERLEEWHCYQARLYRILGLDPTQQQLNLWNDDLIMRGKQSLLRKSHLYKAKRKFQKKALTERRASYNKSSKHTYKGGGGGGMAGACSCSSTCTRGCVCKQAGQLCTGSCHPHNASCTNCVGGRARSSGGGASSSGHGGGGGWPDAVPLSRLALDDELEGATIRYNWEGVGWIEGVLSEYLGGMDDDAADPELKYFCWFDYDGDDGGEVFLTRATYSAVRSAPVDSWHVVFDVDDLD